MALKPGRTYKFMLRAIPGPVHKALKLKAAESEQTMEELIMSFIREGLRRLGGK